MAETRRKFDEDFKIGAVRIVWGVQEAIAQVARTWASTRGRWPTGAPRTAGPAARAPAR